MLKLMWAPSLSDGLCSHVIRNTSSKVRNRRQWRSGAVPDRRELATVLTARQGPRRIAGELDGTDPPWPVKSIIIFVPQLVQIFVFEGCP
jgi:hypothetical protein